MLAVAWVTQRLSSANLAGPGGALRRSSGMVRVPWPNRRPPGVTLTLALAMVIAPRAMRVRSGAMRVKSGAMHVKPGASGAATWAM